MGDEPAHQVHGVAADVLNRPGSMNAVTGLCRASVLVQLANRGLITVIQRAQLERADVHHVGGDAQDHRVIQPHGVLGEFQKSGGGGFGFF